MVVLGVTAIERLLSQHRPTVLAVGSMLAICVLILALTRQNWQPWFGGAATLYVALGIFFAAVLIGLPVGFALLLSSMCYLGTMGRMPVVMLAQTMTRGINGFVLLAVAFFAVLMMSAIPAALTPDVYLSIALISVATLGYTGALANMLSMPADVFPKSAVGSIWGLASMGAGFGGMVFSLATGWVVDHYSYVPVFFGFGLMPLLAAAIVWTLPEVAQASACDAPN